MTIKVISLNAHGLNSPYKRKAMWQETKLLKGDILCTQETHFSRDKQPKCSDKAFPHITMIIVNKSVTFQSHAVITDPKGRYIILVCEINNVKYTLVNLYAPNKAQVTFLRSLYKKMTKHKVGSLLMCGDFNCAVDKAMDCSSSQSTHSYEIPEMDVYDAWRCANSSERDYTYLSAPHNSYSRIDLFLTDFALSQNTLEMTIHAITWSDHAPVTMTLKEQNYYNHAYLWRNNLSILSNLFHKNRLSQLLKEYFEINDTDDENIISLWCAHKAYNRGLFCSTGKEAEGQSY